MESKLSQVIFIFFFSFLIMGCKSTSDYLGRFSTGESVSMRKDSSGLSNRPSATWIQLSETDKNSGEVGFANGGQIGINITSTLTFDKPIESLFDDLNGRYVDHFLSVGFKALESKISILNSQWNQRYIDVHKPFNKDTLASEIPNILGIETDRFKQYIVKSNQSFDNAIGIDVFEELSERYMEKQEEKVNAFKMADPCDSDYDYRLTEVTEMEVPVAIYVYCSGSLVNLKSTISNEFLRKIISIDSKLSEKKLYSLSFQLSGSIKPDPIQRNIITFDNLLKISIEDRGKRSDVNDFDLIEHYNINNAVEVAVELREILINAYITYWESLGIKVEYSTVGR